MRPARTTYRRRRPARRLSVEPLEDRRLLCASLDEAGIVSPEASAECESAHIAAPPAEHNAERPADVNADSAVTALDALIVVNYLNALSDPGLAAESEEGRVYYRDVNGDAQVSSMDALQIVNELIAENEGPAVDPAMIVTAAEVERLLERAAVASASNDAIIAIVDRGGRILGVHVEDDVAARFTGDEELLVFAIDGAVAKARTAAFFSSNAAPLTSRTVRFISQSTVTQREVESNPNIVDADSTLRGPGFVAPIGVGGHFPPGVAFTPPVDLVAIEHQSRDSRLHPGADGIKGTADDLALTTRFNIDPAFIPDGVELVFPESYGLLSARMPRAQSRGIATLPGGIPLYKNGRLVGGIGVLFPGPDGFATHEQGFVAGAGQSAVQRTNAARVLEAEWIAFAAAGGAPGRPCNAAVNHLAGVAPVPGYRLPCGRIDLVGITLEIFGPHPTRENRVTGPQRLLQVGSAVGRGIPGDGENQFVDPGVDEDPTTLADNVFFLAGRPVPEGWLVEPHDSAVDDLTADDVRRIIGQGIAEANLVRAAIRLTPDGRPGERTRMVFAVADRSGEVLGLYRMADATVFSIDVSVAKARNTAYHADATEVLAEDLVDDNEDGLADVVAGTALTNRTYRFLALPRFPSGAENPHCGDPTSSAARRFSGAFSILRDGILDAATGRTVQGIHPCTAENIGPPLPASVFLGAGASVLGFDAFNVSRNFRDPDLLENQNGVVFFPGSTPLYKSEILVGGFGVSGDGVDQDDVVTAAGQVGYAAPEAIRSDQFQVRGVRLPFQKFLRNPHG